MKFHPYKKNITKTTCTKKDHNIAPGGYRWADSGRWHWSKGVIGGQKHIACADRLAATWGSIECRRRRAVRGGLKSDLVPL